MKNKYNRSNEPIVWSLFGAGGMLASFLLPILMLITGILVPLEWVNNDIMAYQRVLIFSDSWLGKLILIATISLPVWHGIHRIYHGLRDFGQKRGRIPTFYLCYGFAALVTVVTTLILIRL